jgi:hypothetical protein
MAGVTPKAGAVLAKNGPGYPTDLDPLVSMVIGGPGGVRPAGLALKLDGDGHLFRLVVLDRDNTALLWLGSYPEEDAVAEWRRLGAASGLVLKIQLPNGSVMTPYPQVGRVLLGPTRIRRRNGLLGHRRPRFLTRRKTGRFPLRPQVHREAEISGHAEER